VAVLFDLGFLYNGENDTWKAKPLVMEQLEFAIVNMTTTHKKINEYCKRMFVLSVDGQKGRLVAKDSRVTIVVLLSSCRLFRWAIVLDKVEIVGGR
jgi:hypothetical protein